MNVPLLILTKFCHDWVNISDFLIGYFWASITQTSTPTDVDVVKSPRLFKTAIFANGSAPAT